MTSSRTRLRGALPAIKFNWSAVTVTDGRFTRSLTEVFFFLTKSEKFRTCLWKVWLCYLMRCWVCACMCSHCSVCVTALSASWMCHIVVRVPRHDVTPPDTKKIPSHKWKRSNYSASHSSLTGLAETFSGRIQVCTDLGTATRKQPRVKAGKDGSCPCLSSN